MFEQVFEKTAQLTPELVARALRTPTSTLWFSPAGQVIDDEHTGRPLEPIDEHAALPDPTGLFELDAELLRPPTQDDDPPDW